MAATSAIVTQEKPEYTHYQGYPVAASTSIYQGTLVALNSSGYLVNAADTAGLKVVGIADESVDNSAGSNGTLTARVKTGVFLLTASSITQAMINTSPAMYVVDNQTVDDAAGATNDIFAGLLMEYVSTTSGWVYVPGIIAHTTSGVTSSVAELNLLDDVTGYLVQHQEATFTETTGAGTYTGSIAVPAGATIFDIIVNGVALWTATTSATLKVGDVADDDGYYTGVDLKATDLLAGESLSFALAGGKAGAYIANSQVSPRYSATARVISGIVTTVGAAGSAGRTRMSVVYGLPTASTAATKV